DWFVPATYSTAKKFAACSREIEANGCGMAVWGPIEARYPGLSQPWDSGASPVPMAENDAIASAAAQWADADAVATHYAYGNAFFCTREAAPDNDPAGLFSVANRAWLEAKFDVKFVSPAELALIATKAMQAHA